MTTMSKKAAVTETLHHANQFSVSGKDSRALVDAAEMWFGITIECQREMMGFMSMRLEKDGESLREMAGCKTMADMITLQSRWVEQTVRDYNSEFEKLTAICTEAAKDGDRTKR
jgi:Phasin protein